MRGMATLDNGCEERAEPVPRKSDGLMANVDPTLEVQILNFRSDSGYRTYYIITMRMTSGDEWKYRNGFLSLFIRSG